MLFVVEEAFVPGDAARGSVTEEILFSGAKDIDVAADFAVEVLVAAEVIRDGRSVGLGTGDVIGTLFVLSSGILDTSLSEADNR